MARCSFGINPVLRELAGEAAREAGGRQAIREALADLAEIWYRRFLPRHFEAEAFGRYAADYTRRRSKYSVRPQVKSGRHRRTILFGGLSIKRPAAGSMKVQISVTLPNSPVGNFWQGRRVTRGGVAHNFPRELRAISGDELAALDQLAEQRIALRLQAALDKAGQNIPMTRYQA